ncbi:MAG: GDSL-type esterase/lipase family protein [Oscillospiraceae bacterium]
MKKLISILLVLALIGSPALALGLTPVSDKSAADFPDIPVGAWYYKAVDTLIRSGGIDGLPDGSFSPENVMTLAQFIKLITALAVVVPADDSGEWYSPYVTAAENAGILDGLDYTGKLDNSITRYDMALITANTAKSLGETLTALPGAERQISDYTSIPKSNQESVLLTYCAGLITGRTDGRFDGEATLKRCEAAAVAVRLFDKESRAVVSGYDYSKPVPECEAVSDDFFKDTLFLGNSLAEGFRLYSGLGYGTHAASVGMTVYSASSSISASARCKSIYIMLGINEIGNGTDVVAQRYSALIDKIKALNPDIDVYVESVLPVCESMLSAQQKQYHITNSYIDELNGALQKMCAEKLVFYLDIHSAIADGSGTLPASKTWDGVHLTPEAYKIWLTYLKTHVA